jgi:hypothetical protein
MNRTVVSKRCRAALRRLAVGFCAPEHGLQAATASSPFMACCQTWAYTLPATGWLVMQRDEMELLAVRATLWRMEIETKYCARCSWTTSSVCCATFG